MNLQEITLKDFIIVATGLAVLIKYVVETYRGISKPNNDQDKQIALMEQKMGGFAQDLMIIKVNHIQHIETDVKALKEGQVRIETILEERLPRK